MMPGMRLEHLRMKRETKSYIDSLYAILTAAHLFEGPKYRLSGLSGMAFKFTVHERLLPLSVTAYGQWIDEHKPAVDNLGLFTVMDAGRTRHPTFRHYQQDAVQWVKESLDQGIGVIYWIPEFGVIDGYDDDDRVFFVQDGWSEEPHIILYDNFGINFTEFWYCQVFGEKADIPYETMLLESLRLAIADWETPYKTLPNKDIGSGKLAYEFLIRALNNGNYDEAGAVYILDSYFHSRKEISMYLREACDIWPKLKEASVCYDRIVAGISNMESCIVVTGEGRKINRGQCHILIESLSEAQSLEDQAIELFRVISHAYPDPKRSTIPRWGTHRPK